jgi:sugar/nucleoside kinase (ribokinase family)
MMSAGRSIHFVGMTTIDIVQVADELPESNRKGRARHAYLDVGGPAANASITASILGSPASLHSAFGQDSLGGLVDSLFAQYEVKRVRYGDDPDVPVSSIWVAEVTGDRTLLSTAASFDGPQPDLVDLSDARAVLLDGFYPEVARVAARAAAERGIPVVLDCGSWREVFVDLLPLASAAIVSEQFVLPAQPDAPAQAIVATLLDQYPLRFAALSRGGDSIVWANAAGTGELQVPVVAAVDTLGAGDVLHGAFLHFAFERDLDDLTALEYAAVVAAGSCEHFGTRSGVEAWASESG